MPGTTPEGKVAIGEHPASSRPTASPACFVSMFALCAASSGLPLGNGSSLSFAASAARASPKSRLQTGELGAPAGHAQGVRIASPQSRADARLAGKAATRGPKRMSLDHVFAGLAICAGAGRWRHRRRVEHQLAKRLTMGPSSTVLGAGSDAGSVDAQSARFLKNRWLTFIGMMMGFSSYYLTRLSFSFVGPVMRDELGFTMVQLGAVSSVFPLAYMNSKFIAGVLADLLGSPVIIFAVGLMCCGLMNLGFTLGSTVPWFTFFWLCNGLLQGCGGSPCGKMLVNWFPAVTRGKWWSTWNASCNIGGFLTPLLAGGIAAQFGWAWGMRVPGMVAIAVGLVCLTIMRDSPEKIGLPSAESHHRERFGSATADAPTRAQADDEDEDEEKEPTWRVLLNNRFLWCMAAMHFFVYFMRQGVMNWAHFYIMDNFGVPAVQATSRVSGFEAGGLLGCIFSGQASDRMIQRNPNAGAAGLRARVMFYYSLVTPIAVLMLWLLPPTPALQWLAMALFGFSIYGPQTLITMTGVESVSKKVAASVSGLLAYPAQLGAMCAGLPFAYLVREVGWRGYFPVLILLSLLSAVSVLPGWNAKSYAQVVAERKAAKTAS
eukprot:TRINITY_DN12545_c0_g2_i1.p1 TRINITY_DN12545_c0_g2~~TRINITY_DN12545_c0_g2_i1.p1  ORF type:complete len:621 (+),score=79.09 TRINITY_DN12545_c0_g2_i1:54-1865(+)